MTLSRTEYFRPQQLNSVKVATPEGSNFNLNGSYFNGATNNGVGATLTNAGSLARLQIDSVELSDGDRVLLISQTNQATNGIYDVINQGSVVSAWILKRSADFQCKEQIRAGYFCTVEAGTINEGSVYTVVEPIVNIVGVDPIIFRSADQDSVPTTKFFSRQITTNGGSDTLVIPFSPCTTDSVCVGVWDRTTNPVSVHEVTAGDGEITVLSSGDPGASSVFSFILTTVEF